MSIAFVQSTGVVTGSNLGASGTFTLSLSGTTAGNLLTLQIAGVDGSGNSNGDPGNVSDGTNTWNHATGDGDKSGQFSHSFSAVYSAYNIAGGNVTLTVTNNSFSTAGYFQAVLAEWSGVATTSAYDSTGSGSNAANSSGAVTCTGGTPTGSAELALVAMSVNATETGLSTPAGWANLGVASSFPSYGFAYLIPSGASALSPSYGTMGTANIWTIALALYKPPSGSPTTITAAYGSFSMTGEAATLLYAQPSSGTLLANPGAFNFNGAQSQSLMQLYANQGSFAETGIAANLTVGNALSTLVAAYGSFVMTGENAALQTLTYVFSAFTGIFTMTGEAALIPATTGLEYLPNFVGMDWLEASLVLYQGGYAEVDPQIVKMKGLGQASHKGLVVGQTPKANSLVPIGCTVQLSVVSDALLAVSFSSEAV